MLALLSSGHCMDKKMFASLFRGYMLKMTYDIPFAKLWTFLLLYEP